MFCCLRNVFKLLKSDDPFSSYDRKYLGPFLDTVYVLRRARR